MTFPLNTTVRTANLPVLNAYADQIGVVEASKPGKTFVRFPWQCGIWFLNEELTAI